MLIICFSFKVALGKFSAIGAKTRFCLNPGEMVIQGTASIKVFFLDIVYVVLQLQPEV